MDYNPENPLPESDIVQSEGATMTVTPVARGKWTHNADFTVATRHDPDGSTRDFDLTAFPDLNAAYLRYFGFTVFTSREDGPQSAYDRLMKPDAIGTKAPRAVKVDFWRKAIALAFMDATKKAPAGQMSIEVATAKALGLDKEKFKAMKLDVAVVRHFNKLSGGTVGVSVASLLAAEAEAEA